MNAPTRDRERHARRIARSLDHDLDFTPWWPSQRASSLVIRPATGLHRVDFDDAIFVAILGLTPIAWIHVAIVTLLESPRHAEIRGLIVTATLRGRGIGEQLVSHAEQWARERGVTRIRVRSNILRERTHAFYERLGYTVTKSQKTFDKRF